MKSILSLLQLFCRKCYQVYRSNFITISVFTLTSVLMVFDYVKHWYFCLWLSALIVGFCSRVLYVEIYDWYLNKKYSELQNIQDERHPKMFFFAGTPDAYQEVHGDVIALRRLAGLQDEFQEEIMRAAIRHSNGIIFSVERPGRHGHVISAMASIGMANRAAGKNVVKDQGFITNKGRYVGRFEACLIAHNAKQIIAKTGPSDRLFSEDVWL